MKLRLSARAPQNGAAIILTLFICTLLAVGIASYLSLTEHQYRMSMRSQEWNASMAVVEAGIEEALEHLNENYTNLESFGWTYSSNQYVMERTLGNSGYSVGITANRTFYPEITARAYAVGQTYAMGYVPGFAYIGATTAGTAIPTRAVRVKCKRSAQYLCTVVTKRWMDLAGNTVWSDSYDSSDPTKSTNGRYDPTKYAGDLGDIASNGGITDTVSLGNASIYGALHVGPETPIAIGPDGGVGTHAWQATHNGFQDGFVTKDANFTFPDTRLPDVAGLLSPSSGTAVVASYQYNTNSVVTTSYPNPVPPGGVYTNVAYKTSLTLPTPYPDWVTTNYDYVTTPSLPSPLPSPLITNIYSTNLTTVALPAPNTYIGGVTTNWHQNRKWILSYSYNLITRIDYTYLTEYYTFPTYTYMYDKVLATPTYVTNYYNQIVEGNQTCVAYSLSGTTLINGPNAVLVLPNGLDGAENIMLNHGASVTIYVGGTSAAITGNNVLNPGGFAGNFILLFDPSVKYIKYSGNGEFTGILVAPEALMELKGSGASEQNFCGAMMVDTLKLNGSFSFHYDEALGKGPAKGRYLITSWDEVD